MNYNPLEFKHDIASIPLKWMLDQPFEPDDSQYHTQAAIMALTGMLTAAVNLSPAAALIQMGVRGETYLHHVSYVRFNPWAKPIFHYWTPASAAERLGGRVGAPVGKFLSGSMWPVSGKTRKAWQKAGTKAGVKVGARIGGRLIPGVGWALLAYDVYDIAYNRSLWGFDF